MSGTTPFAVADVDAGAVDHSALPVLEHLFPFPSPPLDLADDWASWSHHNPNPPVAPVGGPDPVAGQQQQQQQQMDSNGDMAELVGSVADFPCICQLTCLVTAAVSRL